ncbi:MAG: hypothetical protein CL678_11460 [Bdellovibrionaceae bacterium]|nr:hypothetical protein [Pseudobdellovibrionaceae bacterium]|tara:strand:- start:6449 stop:7006 length:558 start_codon:yes stop_codon:yes gene_type:complete
MKHLSIITAVLGLITQLNFAKAEINTTSIVSLMNEVALGLDWKVGDRLEYNISAGFAGSGTLVKEAFKDEGESIWVKQDIVIGGRTEKMEMLINKADGSVLKIIRNGREEQVPNDPPEITDVEMTEVTVPAGTFSATHITGKTKQVKKFEVWANADDTALDGTLKQVANMGFITMTMELTRFVRN